MWASSLSWPLLLTWIGLGPLDSVREKVRNGGWTRGQAWAASVGQGQGHVGARDSRANRAGTADTGYQGVARGGNGSFLVFRVLSVLYASVDSTSSIRQGNDFGILDSGSSCWGFCGDDVFFFFFSWNIFLMFGRCLVSRWWVMDHLLQRHIVGRTKLLLYWKKKASSRST